MTEQTRDTNPPDPRWRLEEPTTNLDEALRHLRRPFEPQAVKWKIQTVRRDGGAIVVGYIDARLVIERLNYVVGGAWKDDYGRQEWLAKNALFCFLTVLGETRMDVGVASEPKALVSDAFKRAGVKWGIGVSIYAMRHASMGVGAEPHQVRQRQQGDKRVPILDDDSLQWLADGYARWIEQRATQFGPPLGHGDDFNPGGMDEEGDEPDLDEAPEVPSEQAEEARRMALEEMTKSTEAKT